MISFSLLADMFDSVSLLDVSISYSNYLLNKMSTFGSQTGALLVSLLVLGIFTELYLSSGGDSELQRL